MSFVSFLKRAGQILANVAAVEAGLEPIFKQNLPASAQGTIDKLDLVFKQIVGVEGMFAKAFPGQQTGAQKVIAAASLIGPVLQSIDTVRGTSIGDEAAIEAAVQKIAGGIADYMNARNANPSSATVAGAVVAAGTVPTAPIQQPPKSAT